MTRMSWGSFRSRTFEAGVDRVVFYPQEGPGVPWNGVIAIREESPNSDIPRSHIDGVPIRTQKTREGFAATLQAYTCPEEFEAYEGTTGILTQQKKKAFDLSYRTRIGDAVDGLDSGSKIHLVYNAYATPSALDFSTLTSDKPNATPFTWALSTTPIDIPGAKPAAHLIIDTTVAWPGAVSAIEDVIYGSESTEPRLPRPDELLDLFEQNAILVIIDHGDGTWTAIGPDDVVYMTDPDTFEINWPSVVYLDEDTYQVSSF